jgi:nonsense-mediated mRNA decay protein 3
VYKHTVVLEIVPVCKDDLVFLPSKLANVIGGISPLVIVHRVSSYIYVVDPTTLQV